MGRARSHLRRQTSETSAVATLGGASSSELAACPTACPTACLEDLLDAHAPEWTAIAVMWDGGDWREVVAERCWLQWSIAQRLTAEEREGRPLPPGSHPG